MTKHNNIDTKIEQAFDKISPSWPLKNFIACNHLQYFTNKKFEEALNLGAKNFQIEDISSDLQEINLQSIKWLNAFFDEGQATINMPNRELGLFASFKRLAVFDKNLHQNNKNKQDFLKNLDENPQKAIESCLEFMKIEENQVSDLFEILIFSLIGFAAFTKYRVLHDFNKDLKNSVSFVDFIAVRILICALISENSENIFSFKTDSSVKKDFSAPEKIKEIISNENSSQQEIIAKISRNLNKQDFRSEYIKSQAGAKAQFVFCIDVRSESIRRAIEAQGNYETFGFAGFFGVFAAVKDIDSEEFSPACPVLVEPKHKISEVLASDIDFSAKKREEFLKNRKKIGFLSQFYQSLKYSFATPFALAEAIGFWCGFWMFSKTLSPKATSVGRDSIKKFLNRNIKTRAEIDIDLSRSKQDKIKDIISGISFEEQCGYALNSLKMMGLTQKFANKIFLCGHASKTENNAYQSSLDCGACAGRSGEVNAKILAEILNKKSIRKFLAENDIEIPDQSKFYAALHETTTDKIELFIDSRTKAKFKSEIKSLKIDLKKAAKISCANRLAKSYAEINAKNAKSVAQKASFNWAETRPEWGLAQNAGFIIGPRFLSQNINLDTRYFLHSYDPEKDEGAGYLETIMTAPLVVAHWINSAYLFSSIDNVSYGAGNKITHNISGKIAAMQEDAFIS